MAITATEDLELAQFDVKTAFLYGSLEEDIYMAVPDGVRVNEEDESRYVCKLNKSLYGLKQSPRCWNKMFVSFLSQFKFKASEADKCIFYKKGSPEFIILALFVDDELLVSRDRRALENVLTVLKSKFNVKISDASSFCGMEIVRERGTGSLLVHQVSYAERILKRFSMFDAKCVPVPAEPGARLERASKKQEDISFHTEKQ